jgi:hypothetical protein
MERNSKYAFRERLLEKRGNYMTMERPGNLLNRPLLADWPSSTFVAEEELCDCGIRERITSLFNKISSLSRCCFSSPNNNVNSYSTRSEEEDSSSSSSLYNFYIVNHR